MALSSNQRRAIAALLTTPTQRAAAAVVGITEATLSGWLRQPDFRRALDQAGALAIEEAAAVVGGAMAEALATLHEIMKDTESSAQDRRAAAVAVLRFGPQLRLIGSIEQRLSQLENQKE
jgi:DNA-binding transcriptional regulator YdaS (Cro superfamily)